VHLYVTSPIDHFAGMLPAELYYERLVSVDGHDGEAAVAPARSYVEATVALIESNTHYDRASDHAAGPFVAALPDAGGTPEGALIVMVKGSNNGSFYIASPFELPWLSDWHAGRVQEAPDRPEW
jgi:hypothetical protein